MLAGCFARGAALCIDSFACGALFVTVVGAIPGAAGVSLGLAAPALYLSASWSGGSPSVGDQFLRLMVIGTDGLPIGWRRGALRAVVGVFSALALFAGFSWMLADERRQTWHDRVARTYVIESPFRDRGLRESLQMATGKQQWRPHPFRVRPEKTWPIWVALLPSALFGIALPFIWQVLVFLRNV